MNSPEEPDQNHYLRLETWSLNDSICLCAEKGPTKNRRTFNRIASIDNPLMKDLFACLFARMNLPSSERTTLEFIVPPHAEKELEYAKNVMERVKPLAQSIGHSPKSVVRLQAAMEERLAFRVGRLIFVRPRNLVPWAIERELPVPKAWKVWWAMQQADKASEADHQAESAESETDASNPMKTTPQEPAEDILKPTDPPWVLTPAQAARYRELDGWTIADACCLVCGINPTWFPDEAQGQSWLAPWWVHEPNPKNGPDTAALKRLHDLAQNALEAQVFTIDPNYYRPFPWLVKVQSKEFLPFAERKGYKAPDTFLEAHEDLSVSESTASSTGGNDRDVQRVIVVRCVRNLNFDDVESMIARGMLSDDFDEEELVRCFLHSPERLTDYGREVLCRCLDEPAPVEHTPVSKKKRGRPVDKSDQALGNRILSAKNSGTSWEEIVETFSPKLDVSHAKKIKAAKGKTYDKDTLKAEAQRLCKAAKMRRDRRAQNRHQES